MSDIFSMPGHLFRRIHQISTALFAEECSASGLTSVQFAALTAIGEEDGMDATRLSAVIAFDRSTLGDVLERLEAKSLIVRRPSPADRRIKLLHLSPQGARVLTDVKPAVRRVQERLLAPLGVEERATMVRLLGQLVGLHQPSPPTTRPPSRNSRPRGNGISTGKTPISRGMPEERPFKRSSRHGRRTRHGHQTQ